MMVALTPQLPLSANTQRPLATTAARRRLQSQPQPEHDSMPNYLVLCLQCQTRLTCGQQRMAAQQMDSRRTAEAGS